MAFRVRIIFHNYLEDTSIGLLIIHDIFVEIFEKSSKHEIPIHVWLGPFNNVQRHTEIALRLLCTLVNLGVVTQ